MTGDHRLRFFAIQFAAAKMRSSMGACIYIEGSSCYGRNGHEGAATDAALLAKSVERPGGGAMVARR